MVESRLALLSKRVVETVFDSISLRLMVPELIVRYTMLWLAVHLLPITCLLIPECRWKRWVKYPKQNGWKSMVVF